MTAETCNIVVVGQRHEAPAILGGQCILGQFALDYLLRFWRR
jgi:hypothetical protein